MDLVLKDLLPEQIVAFKKMAELLKIRTSQSEHILTEEEEDLAISEAIREGMESESLTKSESDSFISSL